MNILFPYNTRVIKTSVFSTEQIRILEAESVTVIHDVENEILSNIENPIMSPPLHEMLNSGETIGILVPDKTRECLAHVMVPCVIDYLVKHGHSTKKIKIFIAIGTHRKMQNSHIKSLVSENVFKSCEIIQPDPFQPDDYQFLGRTSRGTPVAYHKIFLELDRIIVLGSVNFHYFAGFGGGVKIQAICMTSSQTIQANHKLSLSGDDGSFHPNVAPGVLDGNPVYEDMLEIMRFRIPEFLVNVVLDDAGNLVKCFAGDYNAAHREACNYVLQTRSILVQEPADLVIASCGGAPFDIDYIQSHKTLDFACRALKENGTIILVAACPDGIGREGFLSWFEQNKDYGSFRHALSQNYMLNGHTALATFVKTQKFKVMMLTDLPQKDLETMHIRKIENLDDVLKEIVRGLPGNAKIIGIPNGHALLPRLA